MATILVVDDEPVVLRFISMALAMKGHTSIEADSASGGLELAQRATQIDLLIVDHSINGNPGQNLAHDILQFQPRIKVLRISGTSERHFRETGETRPDSFFLQKPFELSKLVETVNQVLRTSSHEGLTAKLSA